MNTPLGQKTKLIIAAVTTLVLLGIWFTSLGSTKKTKRDKLKIVFIGRYLEPDYDKAYTKALQILFDEIEKEHHVDIELIDKSNEGKPEKSLELYQELVKDSSVTLVIDNTWGSDLAAVSTLIKSSKLPVIALKGDHNFSDFGANALFIGYEDYYPITLTKFLKNVLKEKEIYFISEVDYKLHHVYKDAFRKNGINVIEEDTVYLPKNDIVRSEDSLAFVKQFTASLERIKAANKEVSIVLNMHYMWGNLICQYISDHQDSLNILGIESIKRDINTAELFSLTNNQIIILGSPPSDAVPQETALVLEKLYQDSEISNYFRRASQTGKIVKRTIISKDIISHILKSKPKSATLNRAYFKKAFYSLKSNTIITPNNVHKFDERLAMVRDYHFTIEKDGKHYTYPIQLNSQYKEVPNLFLGMKIKRIYNVDITNNTFNADFYYWLRIDKKLLNTENYLFFNNFKEKESVIKLRDEEEIDGWIYRFYEVKGKFGANYDLRAYPFDEHEIKITVEVSHPSDKLRIAFDKTTVNDNTMEEEANMHTWRAESFSVTVDNHIKISPNQDKDFTNRAGEYKQLTYRLKIKRKFVSSFFGLILPLLMIGFIAISMMFVERSFKVVGNISAGLLLSIVTSSIALSRITPDIGSLKKIDWIYVVTLTIVFINFIWIIAHNAFGQEEWKTKIKNKHVAIALLILYPLVILYIIYV